MRKRLRNARSKEGDVDVDRLVCTPSFQKKSLKKGAKKAWFHWSSKDRDTVAQAAAITRSRNDAVPP